MHEVCNGTYAYTTHHAPRTCIDDGMKSRFKIPATYSWSLANDVNKYMNLNYDLKKY